MGVLEDSLITLENGNNKKINDIRHHELILSCRIEGLFSEASNITTLTWSKENPIITKKLTAVTHKWRESVSNYKLINNKLKISQDGLVLFKNDEGITSWGYSKSLRKGYFLFNDKYEFEQINSIKRIREDSEMVCLSVSPNQYYFVNGYLIHNTYICDACETCKILPTLWQWYGPHILSSNDPPISTSYELNHNQQQHYARTTTLMAKKIASSGSDIWSASNTMNHASAWNIFPRILNLKHGGNPEGIDVTDGGWSSYNVGDKLAYYVMKYWETDIVPTSSNNTSANRGPGWIAWLGSKTQSTDSLTNYGNAELVAKKLITDGLAVPLDPWYHGGYAGQGNLDLSARLIHTGNTGASVWYTSNKGASWTEVQSNQSTSSTEGANGGYITINEDTMGGQGNSNIYIIYKFPLHNTSTITYYLKWELEKAPLYNFTSHIFTNCGASGRLGPTKKQCRYHYSDSFFHDDNFFTVTGTPTESATYEYITVGQGGGGSNGGQTNGQHKGISRGIQCWRCPFTGIYKVTAIGAAGGDYTGSINGNWPHQQNFGGHGAKVSMDFKLEGGHWYWILVGQKGSTNDDDDSGCGGGGGTFFIKVPRASNGSMEQYGVATTNGADTLTPPHTNSTWLAYSANCHPPNDSTSSSDILLIAGGGGGASGNHPIGGAERDGHGGYWDNHLNNSNSYWHPDLSNANLAGGAAGSYTSGGGGSYEDDGAATRLTTSYYNGGRAFTRGGAGGRATYMTNGADGVYANAHGGFGGGAGASGHAAGGGGGAYGGGGSNPWSAGGGGGGCIVHPNYGDYTMASAEQGDITSEIGSQHGSLEITYLGERTVPTYLYPFNTFTFTNCGQGGRNGPNLDQCKASYDTATGLSEGEGAWWYDSSYFDVIGASNGATFVGGIQVWTVPESANYTITAKGAKEGWSIGTLGSSSAGLGAIVEATFTLTKGDKYMILVGQMGTTGHGGIPSNTNWYASGGGGGTFMVKGWDYTNITLDDALIVVGGGGGTSRDGNTLFNPGTPGGRNLHAYLYNNLPDGSGGGTTGETSVNGGSGGAGLIYDSGYSNNKPSYRALSFKHGGQGGGQEYVTPLAYSGAYGGFGGGGSGGGNPGGGGGGVYGGNFGNSGWKPNSVAVNFNRGGYGGGSYVSERGTNVHLEDSVTGEVHNNYHGSIRIVKSGEPSPEYIPGIIAQTYESSYPFTSHTFTNCGATGREGPNLEECRYHYGIGAGDGGAGRGGAGPFSFWNNPAFFGVTGEFVNSPEGDEQDGKGIQWWMVPRSGYYYIDAYGASGGDGTVNSVGQQN